MKYLKINFRVNYDVLDTMIEKAEICIESSPLTEKMPMSEFAMTYGFNMNPDDQIGLSKNYEAIVFLNVEEITISEAIKKMCDLGYEGANFQQFLGFWAVNRFKRFILDECSSHIYDLSEQMLIAGTMSVDAQGTSMPGLEMTRETALQMNENRTFSPKTLFLSVNIAPYKNSLTVRTADQNALNLVILGVREVS